MAGWEFWIDRGGTFTDIVARRPDGNLVVRKYLSENPEQYDDAAVHGIRAILAEFNESAASITVKMGTTVGTNALLERRGAKVGLAITAGFADALQIGYQNRPDIFALDIQLPQPLYQQVVEIPERIGARGEILQPLDNTLARQKLLELRDNGCDSLAIVLMHADRHPAHELELKRLAEPLGFAHISLSHLCSPAIRLVRRGSTTVLDAYLSPVLCRYVGQVQAGLSAAQRLYFMQSNGGLVGAEQFHGRDCVLSGPAGGIVGAVKTAQLAGIDKLIGFDMGGTSTDVAHYAGELERSTSQQVAGHLLSVPMLDIHTVAAGGGSILHFDGVRYQVGPDSAGANPGPAAYRRGGPLTVTDCNVMLGRLQARFFPALFGPDGTQPLDQAAVQQKFGVLAQQISQAQHRTVTAEQVAEDFLDIAVDNMANAIHTISVARGRDLASYTLVCFGGAGGQHACRVAARLGMRRILIHPLAGVLSAVGIGLAEQRLIREQSIEQPWSPALQETLEQHFRALFADETADQVIRRVHLRYSGTDTTLPVSYPQHDMAEVFAALHQQRYGYHYPGRSLQLAGIEVEQVHHAGGHLPEPHLNDQPATPIDRVPVYLNGKWLTVPVYQRSTLARGQRIAGPALIVEPNSCTVLEPGWQATHDAHGQLLLESDALPLDKPGHDGAADPKYIELFLHRFMAIAEEMGSVLQQTATSVNIKERLDFSCAVFDRRGQLIANAPHIPVHLGSMGDSVASVIDQFSQTMAPGDAFLINSPYAGGTHLPDITVVSPVYVADLVEPAFYVASRGHHADIGGITPGSMPAFSHHIEEEGALSAGMCIVRNGQILEAAITAWLLQQKWPARNVGQNLADLAAQLAANTRGSLALQALAADYGVKTVQAYMDHALDLGEQMMRQALRQQTGGNASIRFDDDRQVCASISIDVAHGSARIDFSGTSLQADNNFNAPAAVTRAAVLYVFRTLIRADLPLNAGCLRPLEINIPVGSLLQPRHPAAVVAGNVETSQHVVDVLYAALGILAGSQGTMNNLSFGNAEYQYYETLCGGAGASPHAAGASAVHTHMTNSRLTDPEILELRYPVRLDAFAIRRGSGGPGRHKGGDGVVRTIRFLADVTVTLLSSHRIHPPAGLAGGQSGQTGRNVMVRANGEQQELAGVAEIEVHPGDRLTVFTPGGGGFGAANH